MTDLFDPEPEVTAPLSRREVAYYDYTAEDGTVLFQVVRYDPKGFRQRRPLPDGRWSWELDGVDRVPYRLPEVLAADEVIITEGEKDADRLVAEGLVATTGPSGASKWHHEWGAYFAGKSVIILPDNDDPGCWRCWPIRPTPLAQVGRHPSG